MGFPSERAEIIYLASSSHKFSKVSTIVSIFKIVFLLLTFSVNSLHQTSPASVSVNDLVVDVVFVLLKIFPLQAVNNSKIVSVFFTGYILVQEKRGNRGGIELFLHCANVISEKPL